MGTVALTGVVDHMRATSASLRRYNVPPTPSAISSISKTFARKPMAAHKQVGTDVTVLQFSLWYLIPCLHWLCVRVLGVMAHKQGGLDYSLYIGWSCKADLIRATHKLVCHKLGSSASVLLFTRSCKQELQPDLDSREQGGAWEASVLHVHQPVVRCSHISDVANARLCCGIQDARQLTPSERVASNFSPLARGISPRTLEAFIPGGIKPGVTGQPMPSEWREVDEQEEVLGVPEADGVLAATRKHMAFMPLELFDNFEYDPHTPEEWVEIGKEQGVSSRRKEM
eukprot:1161469-Pelagomonas_calceolata.AAC.52